MVGENAPQGFLVACGCGGRALSRRGVAGEEAVQERKRLTRLDVGKRSCRPKLKAQKKAAERLTPRRVSEPNVRSGKTHRAYGLCYVLHGLVEHGFLLVAERVHFAAHTVAVYPLVEP